MVLVCAFFFLSGFNTNGLALFKTGLVALCESRVGSGWFSLPLMAESPRGVIIVNSDEDILLDDGMSPLNMIVVGGRIKKQTAESRSITCTFKIHHVHVK